MVVAEKEMPYERAAIESTPLAFKQTEVGLIPSGWEVKELKAVIQLVSGQHILNQDYNNDTVGIPYLTGPADFGFVFPTISKWTEKPKALALNDDIIITVKGDGVGKINLVNLPSVAVSRQLMAIRPKGIFGAYLYHLLTTLYNYFQDSSSGSTVPGLSRNDISRVIIPVPTLAEQRAIATALSDVDALITSLDALITKKRNIKQGAMQQLLTGQKRLPGFSGEWQTKTLDSFADVKSGKRLPLGRSLIAEETPYPYIRVTDMFQGGVSADCIMYVPEDVYPSINQYRIFVDDIFISVAGTLGIVGKIPEKLNGANLTENADRITSIQCSSDYLLYFLMSSLIQKTIESESTLGAQPKLALTRIRKFEIPLPPTLAEQRAIAQILSDMDAELDILTQKRDKYKAVKQGMMQQLLTGKILLPVAT